MKIARLSVVVWNEFIHERRDPAVRAIYPDGVHAAIAAGLRKVPGFNGGVTLDVTTATLDEPEHGLSKARIDACDVLIWWGHLAHERVSDEVVQRIHRRVLEGMGVIVLHSGYASKLFRRLQGTSCALRLRSGKRGGTAVDPVTERISVVEPMHPIASGLGERFELSKEEMYGESFDIAPPDSTVFISWFEGGEVFRSGCCWERGYGRLFYFRPGNIAGPTFHDANVQRVLANAVHWVAPRFRFAEAEPPTDAVTTPPCMASAPAARASRGKDQRRRAGVAVGEPELLFPTLIGHLQARESERTPLPVHSPDRAPTATSSELAAEKGAGGARQVRQAVF